MQRRGSENHAFLAGELFGCAHCDDYGHLLKMLEVVIRHHDVNIAREPAACGGSHPGNLPQLVAKAFFGLGVDTAVLIQRLMPEVIERTRMIAPRIFADSLDS